MLTIVKITNPIVKAAFLLCGLLFAAVVVPPVSAHAQCTNWSLGTDLTILQRGVQLPIFLSLQQKGSVVTGEARAKADGGFFDPFPGVRGTVDGTFDGNSLSVQIYWQGNLTGVYNGKVLPSGRLDGDTYDKNNTNIRQTWHSYGLLECAPIPQSTPPRPKPITRSGKARSETVAPPLNPPFITAGAPIRIPFVPGASVYLGWDGGPDHPNAEVWVSINNAAEISAALVYGPALKQPKIAAMELKLQPGLYKYFLKDAGTTLSTVVVVVP